MSKHWSPEETKILESNHERTARQAQASLKRAGYERTEAAVHTRRRELAAMPKKCCVCGT